LQMTRTMAVGEMHGNVLELHRVAEIWNCDTITSLADNFIILTVKQTYVPPTTISRRMQSRSWLRHYATSSKVAGSIPDKAIGIFN
jgi:hypothetical protein